MTGRALISRQLDLLPATQERRRAVSRKTSKRYRKRSASGEVCCRVGLPRAETEDMLIAKGYLTPAAADDRAAFDAAVERFVRDAILNAAAEAFEK